MDKCILVIGKFKPSDSKIVRLRPEAMKIIRQLQCETGLSASYIVGEMIQFCKDRIEIREEE